MTKADYSKLDIAVEYLNAAMQMYLDHRNYFCAIHLAAAASELFDFHLPPEKSRLFDLAWRAERGLHAQETGIVPEDKDAKAVVNWSKNAIKHMNDDERVIHIDPPVEAWWWIEHALLCFYRLGLPKTPTIWKYEDYAREQVSLNTANTSSTGATPGA